MSTLGNAGPAEREGKRLCAETSDSLAHVASVS